ncbi:hypothetical protein H6G17_01500 [Chroococcidiopsis sp. FACHB-1243]|uniref:hypothetical protein n=1 Tax=Chroococcidiopsis sp. [FACHB-1243] TaxID=2692781 RepID=UPI001780041A|nr:hypothetical protein [Chroococcidiopsis sp. [FACHB-1243]]MBD2304197.1 hypothetical protein [Chroococcidiopsis sp. [FACHB-1243]]
MLNITEIKELKILQTDDECVVSGGATASAFAEATGSAEGPNSAIWEGFTFTFASDSGGTRNPNHIARGGSRSGSWAN